MYPVSEMACFFFVGDRWRPGFICWTDHSCWCFCHPSGSFDWWYWAEDSHSVQSMGHLSLVGGECLNASSSSGNIGSRAAHLPNVSPFFQTCYC